MDLKPVIKDEAYKLGFTLAGFTHPGPPSSYPVFSDWIGRGNHAGMHYLASHRSLECRKNPAALLPGCRSILVLGLPYSNPLLEIQNYLPSFSGRIAAYAWGRDYHNLIPTRLEKLAMRISELTKMPVNAKGFTDTSPILEHDLAQRAGLGWIGKNSMLINPRFGSFFFIAELFLDIEIEPDLPFSADRCGNCRRCIEACPTQCIHPNRTIDSNRCISYLTIENRGMIPQDLRHRLQNWIFGCDICQMVCPWNQRITEPIDDKELVSGDLWKSLDSLQLVGISTEEFSNKFAESPLNRSKRAGLLRNAAVTLGNIADPLSIPALEKSLFTDPEPIIRAHAAWALSRIKSSQAQSCLIQAKKIEENSMVLEEIVTGMK